MTGDWLGDRLRDRLQPIDLDDDEPEAEPPVSFDGGARSSMPARGPSMSEVLRRARHGDVVGIRDEPRR